MLASFAQFIAWLATVDRSWIPAAISMTSILLAIYSIKRTNWASVDSSEGEVLFLFSLLACTSGSWSFAAFVSGADNKLSFNGPYFWHFVLWHLLALGLVGVSIVSFLSFKGLNRLWRGWLKPKMASIKKRLGDWVSWQRHVRGVDITAELKARRAELEEILGAGPVSSIGEQVRALFEGPLARLLKRRKFLLENQDTFDRALNRGFKNQFADKKARAELEKNFMRLSRIL